jgi:hypothetical protein
VGIKQGKLSDIMTSESNPNFRLSRSDLHHRVSVGRIKSTYSAFVFFLLALLLPRDGVQQISAFFIDTRHRSAPPLFHTKHQLLENPSTHKVQCKLISHFTFTTLKSQRQRQAAVSLQLATGPSDETTAPDAKEWKAVLAAFTLYKAAFGDLKVPQRFVVPTMKPWPRPCWNMKLGKIVGDIRSTGKYLNDEEYGPERRQALENIGFVWRMRAEVIKENVSSEHVPLDQLFQALQAYREFVVGDSDDAPWTVPANFYIPNFSPWPTSVRGLPLGQQIVNLQRRLEQNPEMKAKLKTLGMDGLDDDVAPADKSSLSVNDERFQKVYACLIRYKEIYGDVLVPQPFAVPSTDAWPKDTWGLRLGARVNAIRSQGTFVNSNPERRKLLDELGFVWMAPKEGTRRKGRLSRADSDAEDAWEMMRGVGLDDKGFAMSAMDSLFDESFDFEKGFDFPGDAEKTAPTWGLEGGRKEAAQAAEDAKQAQIEYVPPQTFAESLEIAKARAMEVGIIQGVTPEGRVIKGKQEYKVPWFNDDFGDDFVFDDVVEALTIYKKLYGDFSNLTQNVDFVVPSPIEITGFLNTDETYDSFDTDSYARTAAALASFEEQGEMDSTEELVAAEIKRLQNEIGEPYAEMERNVAVATRTAVAQDWPEHLAGMTLGSIVARIRDGSLEVKHIPEREKRLDALNFDWGDPMHFIDVPFEKAMCAMYAYYLVRGDLLVTEDFVMPGEAPWPEALAGYEVGKAVARIRQLQNFFEEYHPEKVYLLRMVDFMWFRASALPLDPNEEEMSDEMMMLQSHGHPDNFMVWPFGLKEKLKEAGPFFETDDPKQQWRIWHNWDFVKDVWYKRGRRDNAFYLRRKGYPQMADEHEAKYGPGMFTQINETLQDIESGLEGRSDDQLRELYEKLLFFREEMYGCADMDFDEQMEIVKNLQIRMKELVLLNPSLSMITVKKDNEEFEAVNGERRIEEELEYEGVEDEELDVEEMEEAYDIIDELEL